MTYHQDFRRPHPAVVVIKWAAGLFLACAFLASAVCKADTPDTEGRLYNDIETIGISGSSEGPQAPLSDNGHLPSFGLSTDDCSAPPSVPLPAAVWAGIAAGSGIFLKRTRRAKR